MPINQHRVLLININNSHESTKNNNLDQIK